MSCGPQKTASKIVLNYSNPIGYGGGPSIKVTLDLDKKGSNFPFPVGVAAADIFWHQYISLMLNLFFGRVSSTCFLFLNSPTSILALGVEVYEFQEVFPREAAKLRHRTPNHFLSVFLLISAAIAFAIMWQNFPQQLRLRTLPTMSVCLLSLFFEHFFQLEIFTF